MASDWIPKFAESIAASVAAGEAADAKVLPALAGWFVHHLAVMVMIHLLPARPVIDYGLPREQLVEQAVVFTLRGMGLKESAVKRFYNPKRARKSSLLSSCSRFRSVLRPLHVRSAC